MTTPLVIGTPKAGVLNVHNGGAFECLALASSALNWQRVVSYFDLAYILSLKPKAMVHASWPLLAVALILVLFTLMMLVLFCAATPYIWPRCCHERTHICCWYFHNERCCRCSYSISCCVKDGWRELAEERRNSGSRASRRRDSGDEFVT